MTATPASLYKIHIWVLHLLHCTRFISECYTCFTVQDSSLSATPASLYKIHLWVLHQLHCIRFISECYTCLTVQDSCLSATPASLYQIHLWVLHLLHCIRFISDCYTCLTVWDYTTYIHIHESVLDIHCLVYSFDFSSDCTCCAAESSCHWQIQGAPGECAPGSTFFIFMQFLGHLATKATWRPIFGISAPFSG